MTDVYDEVREKLGINFDGIDTKIRMFFNQRGLAVI